MNKNVKHSGAWTVFFTLLSIAYVFPIILVFINSFKKKAYISRKPFAIPRDKMFVGLENYVKGMRGILTELLTQLQKQYIICVCFP